MKYNKSLDHALMATYFARKAVKAKSTKLKAAFRAKALKSILTAGAQRDAEQGMRVLEASLRLAAANEGLIDEELPEVDMSVEANDGFDDIDVDVEAEADEDADVELDEDIDVEADADEEDDDVEVDVELDDEDDEDEEAEEVSASVKRIMARAAARKRLAARAAARKRLAARARIRR
jgi:hypothetical protein|nr:MAG TPA: hypothetical protein [Caudoviricetes sp.]